VRDLPIRSHLIAYIIAAAAAVSLASLAVWPLRSAAQRDFKIAIRPDIIPVAPITISGHILFEKRSDISFGMEPSCSPLCLAMLDLDGVETVTMIRDGIAKTFAIETVDPKDNNPPESLKPYDPSQIITMAGQSRDYKIDQQVKDRLEEYWSIRLKGPERLVAIDRPAGVPTWHLITYTDSLSRFQEIRGPENEPVLRYQSVGQDLLAIPPYIEFKASASGFGFMGRGVQIAASGLFKQSAAPTAYPEDNFARAFALKDYWSEHAGDIKGQSRSID